MADHSDSAAAEATALSATVVVVWVNDCPRPQHDRAPLSSLHRIIHPYLNQERAAGQQKESPAVVKCTAAYRYRTVFLFLSAMTSHTHTHPPKNQNVSRVRMKCSAWFGPSTTGVVGSGSGMPESGRRGAGGT